MLLELYIFFEVLLVGLFLLSFFTKHEILWSLTGVFAGIMMFNSFDIQYYVYEYNSTLLAYQPVMVSFAYEYLAWMNGIFLGLVMVLGMFDIFDKYGAQIIAKIRK